MHFFENLKVTMYLFYSSTYIFLAQIGTILKVGVAFLLKVIYLGYLLYFDIFSFTLYLNNLLRFVLLGPNGPFFFLYWLFYRFLSGKTTQNFNFWLVLDLNGNVSNQNTWHFHLQKFYLQPLQFFNLADCPGCYSYYLHTKQITQF